MRIIQRSLRLTALCPGLPGWAGTRKVKPWILLKQETVSGSAISWDICKSAHCSRKITMPTPHRSVVYRLDALPAAQPTASKHWRLLVIYYLFENTDQTPDIPYIVHVIRCLHVCMWLCMRCSSRRNIDVTSKFLSKNKCNYLQHHTIHNYKFSMNNKNNRMLGKNYSQIIRSLPRRSSVDLVTIFQL